METEKSERPLSPHLTIYRPQFTSVLSILHRITGLSLAFSTFLVVFWFVSIALGKTYYLAYSTFILSKPVQLLLILSIWAIWYHTCTGIRHLFWDCGLGLQLEWIGPSSFVILVFSTGLSIFTIYFGWFY